ncbi:MAG: hypothetical protein JWQ29_2309 [Phenylobacterium sp.]|nr:hypothetical protein [Phenylobacterium sp.]
MTPIRPGLPPASPAPTAGADAARLAAQKAFFQQAMGRPAPAAAAAPAQAHVPALPVRTVEVRPQAGAEAPTKILRPGSLLDIRV